MYWSLTLSMTFYMILKLCLGAELSMKNYGITMTAVDLDMVICLMMNVSLAFDVICSCVTWSLPSLVLFVCKGAVMIFHHLLSISGNGFVLYRGTNGTELMATLFGSEITNPVLQLRWFLRYTGVSVHTPTVAVAVDFCFLMLFTVMRIGIGSFLLYCYLRHPRPDWVARFASLIIYGLGWVFWYSIMCYAIRKYGHNLNFFRRLNHKVGNLDNSLNITAR